MRTIIIMILAILCHHRTFASDTEMHTDNDAIFTREFIEKEMLGDIDPDQKLDITVNILGGVLKEIADLMPKINTCDGIVTIVRRKRRHHDDEPSAEVQIKGTQEGNEGLKEAINQTAKKVAIALIRKGKTFHPHMTAHIWQHFVCHGWSSHHRLISIADFSDSVKMSLEGLKS
ncbi:hypothetical protein DdX_09210 [Ditylenchus destructor]|uniref:Uncharacterized protein n=1 Tax=Ditylenchus destructor TaxID=166010 RepID=A0AAD4R6H1_9BILA|nr:hypothetical protein DdX_09210 [Ditylenchus destructor]